MIEPAGAASRPRRQQGQQAQGQAGRAACSRVAFVRCFGCPLSLRRSLRSLRFSITTKRPPPFSPRRPPARATLAGWARGAGGDLLALSCAPFSPFALRSAVRPTRLSPAPCSRGVLQASRPSPFPPAVIARGRCRPPSAASATGSTTGGAGAACFHHPPSSRQGGAAASALSPSGTLPRGIRRDIA